VVRSLAAGDSLEAVTGWYQAAYGEPADPADFVETLLALDFIRLDSETETPDQPGPKLRWQRLANVVFSAPALCAYALAAGITVWLMWLVPALRPSPSRVFFSRSILVVMGVTCVAQLLGVMIHEGFHALAGRRLGLFSRLSIGRRVYFLVFQTTLVGIFGDSGTQTDPAILCRVDRRRLVRERADRHCRGRSARRIAAMAWSAGRNGLAYLTLLRMLWQAMIFMETDLYHVLA
jgi:hypothetical protein